MPFDLDAILAEEAAGDQPKPYTFTFDKKTITLPGTIDARVFAALEDGPVGLPRALRMLAGPQQWEQIEASPQVLTFAALDTLIGDWLTHTGAAALGKPSRSTRRSKKTATPSKRTSRGTTASASLKSVRKN